MKKAYFISFLFYSFFVFSQFNPSAPWMTNEITSKRNGATINEISNEFNAYWETHDKNKKGSGYKPYKRWEYHWENKTNEQGYVISPQEMWDAWNQKNNSIEHKNAVLPPSNWQPVGPFTHTNTGSWSSGQGRVNFVCQDPNNTNTIYLGAPAGGIWKSTDSGMNWQPMSDYLPQIGVSGIAVDHTNSNVIYIATGDKDGSSTYSIGVLKSIDGGVTWNTTGLTFTGTNSFAGDIIMHPANNQILFCATSAGLYKTIDAGANWTIVQTGDFSQGAIRFKPNDPTIVYATGRTTIIGDTTDRFYRSTNTGNSFTNITSVLPAASGRLLLDVTPANQDYVYVLSSKPYSNDASSYAFQGIYRSTNSGLSFTGRNTTTDVFESSQAWYDLALAVSDTNAEEVFTGCLNVWKSTNGGTSFTKVNNWNAPTSPSYTHADIHYLGFYAGNLYAGTDGGVYVSQNSGTNFTDLTATAQISQFYKIAVSKQSAGNMVGGLQDNGGHAYSNGEWKNYYGADGMDTAIDPNNPNLYYGFIQNGSSMYISNTAGNGISGNVSAPGGQTGNWVTPLVANSAGELFSGFAGLYRLNGSSWIQQNIANIGSGNLELITIDPSNDDIMYVTNGNALYKSINHGVNFSLIYTASSTIRSIEVHSYDSNIVYIVTSGTSGQVLKSIDGGSSFSNFSTGLPNIGKNVIVHQGQHTDNPLYVGTSLGVYYRDDTMSSWQPFDTNLPNVSVTDLEINLNDAKLVAATYGRGIWQTDIPVQVPNDDVKLVSIDSPNKSVSCGDVIPSIAVKNNGTNSISTVLVNYEVDGTPYSFTWNGTLASLETTTISLPVLNLARGTHEFTVTTSITNDAFPDNNSAFEVFYVNDLGTVGMMNTFSNATDELISYTEGSSSPQWVRGVRNGGALTSGFANYVYTTNLTGNYPDKTKAYLVSQCYNLTNISNPEISFKMKYDLELNWDIVYVEYTTDFGENWNVLGTMGSGWYNSDRTQATAGNDCYNCPGAQWTGTNTTNTTYTYPLTSINNESNVIFRIVFHSDDAENQLGVNIDDFVINGVVLSSESFKLNKVSIYPNPSSGMFKVELGDFKPKIIEVYDISGKNIYSITEVMIENFETTIDLSNISSGIYFIKMFNEDQNLVKRIIKK